MSSFSEGSGQDMTAKNIRPCSLRCAIMYPRSLPELREAIHERVNALLQQLHTSLWNSAPDLGISHSRHEWDCTHSLRSWALWLERAQGLYYFLSWIIYLCQDPETLYSQWLPGPPLHTDKKSLGLKRDQRGGLWIRSTSLGRQSIGISCDKHNCLCRRKHLSDWSMWTNRSDLLNVRDNRVLTFWNCISSNVCSTLRSRVRWREPSFFRTRK